MTTILAIDESSGTQNSTQGTVTSNDYGGGTVPLRFNSVLVDEDIAAWNRTLAGLGGEGKTSMLQDVEARRPTEIDYLNGGIARFGRSLGVPTPLNRAIADILALHADGAKA